MPYAELPDTDDPLARAARTQKKGRIVTAIAIVAFLGFTPPVCALVDRLLPGRLPIWILLVWISSIIGVALLVERQGAPGPGGPSAGPR